VPTFANAAKSYQGGADTGIQLAEGAATIDENLLKLRDGAAELLAGLIKLRDGSNQLYVGLAGTAVPGARKLADGAGQLADGTGQLAEGTGKLSAGTVELDAGAALLSGGQQDLLAGLRLLDAGVEGLPQSVREGLKTNDDYQALLQAMGAVVTGIGDDSQVTDPVTGKPATIFGGLNAIKYGLRSPYGYAQNDCLASLLGQVPQKCGAMDAVQTISEQLASSATSAQGLYQVAQANYQVVAATNGCPALVPGKGGTPVAPASALPAPGAAPSTPCHFAAVLVNSIGGAPGDPGVPLGGIIYRSTAASGALKQTYTAVDAGIVNKAIPGLKQGLHNPNALADCAKAKETSTPADDCGIRDAVSYFQKVAIPSLVDGLTNSIADELSANIGVPAGGCQPDTKTLVCGGQALADGGQKLAAGTGELAAGAGELDEGAGKIDDGAGQVADGSDQLADGLGDAADGSRQITDGLGQAADGAPKLVDGAGRLSDEGTSKLVEAGEDTAQNYGELYATIEAGAELADASKMAYGGPEGSQELMAYSYVIEGENGETGRNLARGLTGLALLGAGAAAFAFRRMA
jgi:putative membrane protein